MESELVAFPVSDPVRKALIDLLIDIESLRNDVLQQASARLVPFKRYYPDGEFSAGAYNLAHYLSLRSRDLRPLQTRLSEQGLSSLGRGEPHVVANLERIIDVLCRAVGRTDTMHSNVPPKIDLTHGSRILKQNTDIIFGPPPSDRDVRIMVTLPTEAAWNFPLVQALVDDGMNCARINCAHDDPGVWRGMVKNVRKAAEAAGLPCKILMDLAGPKIRTGPVKAGPAIMHIKPRKDEFGNVIAPARVLIEASSAVVRPDATGVRYRISLPKAFLRRLTPGSRLCFVDARGKNRYLQIESQTSRGDWLAECPRGVYLDARTTFEWRQPDKKGRFHRVEDFPLTPFEGPPLPIHLFQNDLLLLIHDNKPGKPAEYGDDGNLISPARIGCTYPGILKHLKLGDPVWIDDGKIGTVVEAIEDQGISLRVTHIGPNGAQLRAEKGFNFPNTSLELHALGDKDLSDLDFVCDHADMVGLSFVETLDDINLLIEALKTRNASRLPIIVKIETGRAVKNLPELILGTMGRHTLGIMIARGDLSVELGSVRLAEIQEEILWLCEAAHIPVIWATQVLETLTKKGTRSRPEFTDAAMGVRAECVMLNKGPYILQAVRALNNVLEKMQAHQHKKMSRLRALSW